MISWASTNYHVHKAFPEIVGREAVLRRRSTYILGTPPGVEPVVRLGRGHPLEAGRLRQNRAEFTFIAGGVVPGVLVLKPDFPRAQEDWPFLWGENEYVVDICAHWIFLANAANDLLRE